MARRRVTYLEVADAPPRRPGAAAVLDLDGWQRAPAGPAPRPVFRERRPCPTWLAHLALVALLAGGAALDHATTGPDERRAADREQELPELPAAEPIASRTGPVEVPTRSIIGEPWSGVFEHHPDARGVDPVARVHALTLAGPGGRGLLVVDATRRAFGGPEHPTGVERAPRRLGAGDGLATLQWDAGGYGLSLTSVGLDPRTQEAIAGGVRLPDGSSLDDGRPPIIDEEVLRAVGLSVTGVTSGAASAFGSPLIGQGGGASIEGQLHQDGHAALLVSVVQDQRIGAGVLRDALGSTVSIDASAIPGVTAAAALDHGPAAQVERRIRGWSRLVLDHAGGVTVELSSDVLRPAELLEAARAMDVDRLVRTTAPLGAG